MLFVGGSGLATMVVRKPGHMGDLCAYLHSARRWEP